MPLCSCAFLKGGGDALALPAFCGLPGFVLGVCSAAFAFCDTMPALPPEARCAGAPGLPAVLTATLIPGTWVIVGLLSVFTPVIALLHNSPEMAEDDRQAT